MLQPMPTNPAYLAGAVAEALDDEQLQAEITNALTAALSDYFATRFPYEDVLRVVLRQAIIARLPELATTHGPAITTGLRRLLTEAKLSKLVDQVMRELSGLPPKEDDGEPTADDEVPVTPPAAPSGGPT